MKPQASMTDYLKPTDAQKTCSDGIPAPACWSDDRAEELKILRQLLAVVAGLNNGSGFLESVRECITIAERLRYSDIAGLRLSFIDHLERDCIAERVANKGKLKHEDGCSSGWQYNE
jgi:hypothetical protein